MAANLCGADKRSGGPCGRPAGWGTGHVGIGRCKFHGGSTPNHEMSAAVELARRETAMHALPLDIEPHEALLQCVQIAAGWVRYAFERLNELGAGDLVGPVVTTRPLKEEKGAESRSERVEEHGPPAVHIWLKVHGEWSDRLVGYAKIALAAGVEERRVRIAEGQAEILAEFAKNLLRDVGIDPASEKAREVMGRNFRLLAGGLAA